MKTLISKASAAGTLLSSGVAVAQTGTMMNGSNAGFGWMGGYGGAWMPLLLIVVVVALVVLIFRGKGK